MSRAILTMDGDGLYGSIVTNGELYELEPEKEDDDPAASDTVVRHGSSDTPVPRTAVPGQVVEEAEDGPETVGETVEETGLVPPLPLTGRPTGMCGRTRRSRSGTSTATTIPGFRTPSQLRRQCGTTKPTSTWCSPRFGSSATSVVARTAARISRTSQVATVPRVLSMRISCSPV